MQKYFYFEKGFSIFTSELYTILMALNYTWNIQLAIYKTMDKLIDIRAFVNATVCLYYIFLSIYLFVSVFVLLCVYLEIDLNGDCTTPNDTSCKTGLTCDANACSKCGVFNIRENVYA